VAFSIEMTESTITGNGAILIFGTASHTVLDLLDCQFVRLIYGTAITSSAIPSFAHLRTKVPKRDVTKLDAPSFIELGNGLFHGHCQLHGVNFFHNSELPFKNSLYG
jgi:hypothetical protein